MSNKPFQFKQFMIQQDRCAMKIGTDGVLIGAWTPLDHTISSILDIGTGTGVVALILAQRSQAELIDALEIDGEAYEQAVENFEASHWADRLFCYHASFQEFVEEVDDKYDVLISNPPFYTENYKTNNKSRDLARFEDALPFEHLISGAIHLLKEDGKLSMIIPFTEESKILKLAKDVGLFPEKITRVKGTPYSDCKRSMLLLRKTKSSCELDTLIIEDQRHQYTKEYIALTNKFYLKMK